MPVYVHVYMHMHTNSGEIMCAQVHYICVHSHVVSGHASAYMPKCLHVYMHKHLHGKNTLEHDTILEQALLTCILLFGDLVGS